ncbi:hypothetical protein AXF42_Ash005730 [Apostasia shenzhenica]|uniref:GIR1-like zinc ribbon domain-containing protein n=1 Tax=Apostasia shenzhenica TaxID=1088818 RepID=A0A2I0BC72_9ASPA|nr:hypothetical protein AXF42_Ash005730 [Apostasia shenzhenica]
MSQEPIVLQLHLLSSQRNTSSSSSPAGEPRRSTPDGKVYTPLSGMSRGKTPKIDLKLNLSPPARGNHSPTAADDGGSPFTTSPPSSCVSSDGEQGIRCSNSPEATSMVLAGCPRCLMYVMLSEDDPKCPKCKSTVLLDFLHEDGSTKKMKKS